MGVGSGSASAGSPPALQQGSAGRDADGRRNAVVLVAFATKHGATEEIAQAIGQELRIAGFEADVLPVGQVASLDRYGAVVLGSAVYFGRWRKEALRFGEQHSAELRGRAVWLFDSGPTNTSADAGKNEPVAAADALAEAVGARGRTTFGGRFRREDAGPFTRRVVDKGNSPGLGFGDFRNFDRIRGWARQIASELTHGPGHPKADSYPVVAAPA